VGVVQIAGWRLYQQRRHSDLVSRCIGEKGGCGSNERWAENTTMPSNVHTEKTSENVREMHLYVVLESFCGCGKPLPKVAPLLSLYPALEGWV
jgi:hypothetical protein